MAISPLSLSSLSPLSLLFHSHALTLLSLPSSLPPTLPPYIPPSIHPSLPPSSLSPSIPSSLPSSPPPPSLLSLVPSMNAYTARRFEERMTDALRRRPAIYTPFAPGTRFACFTSFTGTKVQTLTLEALLLKPLSCPTLFLFLRRPCSSQARHKTRQKRRSSRKKRPPPSSKTPRVRPR